MTYLALALAIVLAVLPHAVHDLAPYAVAALWALAAGRRARARYYHWHRWEHRNCHARPTRLHRARLAARRARTLRLRTETTARTA